MKILTLTERRDEVVGMNTRHDICRHVMVAEATSDESSVGHRSGQVNGGMEMIGRLDGKYC